MKRSTLMTHGAIFAALGLGLGVAACNPAASVQQAPAPAAALPLTTAAAPPIVDAPTAEQLPPAPPARIARVANPRDAYAYADQAYAMSNGLGDAPPDYTFDYSGARPWVWRADNDAVRVVEPLPNGDRYYYYQPGQTYPYLVRDPDYTYGYDNGALVVVYDHEGRQLPPDFVERRADYAGRYLYRGRDLYLASQQAPRQPVAAANWTDRRVTLAAELATWALLQNQQPDWRAYHDAHQDQEAASWDQERYRREAEAARTDNQLNDHQAAQRDLQAAQQAQADARNHGQTVPGAQGGGFFGQRQNPPKPQQPTQTPPSAQYGPPTNQGAARNQNRRQDAGPQQSAGVGQGERQGPSPLQQAPRATPMASPAQTHQQPSAAASPQGRQSYITPEQAAAGRRQAQVPVGASARPPASPAPEAGRQPNAAPVQAPPVRGQSHAPAGAVVRPQAQPAPAAGRPQHPMLQQVPPHAPANPAAPVAAQHPGVNPAEKGKPDGPQRQGERDARHPGDPAN